MALSLEQRRKLLAASLPESDAVRKDATAYMARSGLTVPDLARRLGYGSSSLHLFIQRQYERVAGSDASIRGALVDYMHAHPLGLGVQEEAAGHLYQTKNVKLLRRYFYDALEHGRAAWVEGAPGSQKTFVMQHLIAELNRAEISKNGDRREAFYIYCRSDIGPGALVKRIAVATGTMALGSVDRILGNLRFDFSCRRALLVFDEAQHLDVRSFELVRELLDRPPHFGLLFVGSHQLKRFFLRNGEHLEQWLSRLRQGVSLPGISEEEALEIVAAETQGRLHGDVARRFVRRCRASALTSDGQKDYISARRLFLSLADLKEAKPGKRPVASVAASADLAGRAQQRAG